MKKKILFVLNHFQFSDGVAATLRSLIMNIDMNKYDVHILPLFRIDYNFLEPVKDRVTVHRGFGFYSRGLSRIVGLLPLNLLYRLLIKDDYDLEVAYQYGLATKVLSVSPNKHKICWMHGYDTNMTFRKFYTAFNKIISVAKEGCDKLKKEGFLTADYCHNIIDETNILSKSLEPIDIKKKRRNVVTTVSRISPEKAIMRQLRCIERINEHNKNFEYWIIGGGPDFENVKNYVKEHDMTDYVRLLGPQKNPYKYLAKSDLFLLGSKREGLNTACQEASILGIPVISTDVDGAREIIELSGCGQVIPNEENEIVKELEIILSNEIQLKQWKQIAELNMGRFYKQPRIEKIERILDDAMK